MFDNIKAGKQISFFRKNKGITQEELSQRLSVSPQAISKWENGHTMPEVSVLVKLAEILGTTIDEILMPGEYSVANANFEHILLPYGEIADFSGKKWPRSMAHPAILSAIKLFMGVEVHRDSQNRQLNDDNEYILQSAFTSICFGYSWGRGMCEKDCLAVYGLSYEIHNKHDYSDEEIIQLATKNILKGYPVVIEPKEYTDTILATGFSHGGKILKGLAFLDGDDDKNSVMSFKQLQNFSGWYREDVNLILIKPSEDKVTVAEACRNALQEGYVLLCNEVHQYKEPLVGYGLVIYDNWCKELQKENETDLETIDCLYPHIFIHYESKMRTKEFLELCVHILEDINKSALEKAISKYDEILDLCQKAMPRLLTERPKDAWDAKSKREGFIRLLQRTKELEMEALSSWALVIEE
ncbi:MAG: helix-turn-helix transcriptional regulator [Lachnospiraceae bacterium]|nr:helix-turn-helix transcriptional regulator [Lachnospiraceae bacterium]